MTNVVKLIFWNFKGDDKEMKVLIGIMVALSTFILGGILGLGFYMLFSECFAVGMITLIISIILVLTGILVRLEL